MNKPFSPSCERNSEPITKILKEALTPNYKNLLEIGSGTGQHAAYIAKRLPHITWNCSDVKSNHEGIELWTNKTPIEFEIGKNNFPHGSYDVVFTANTFHIMSLGKVKLLIELCGESLKEDSLVIIYGPFNYNGRYTSESNANFDTWLKDRDPESAIRNFEDICDEMKRNGLNLQKDYEMPANNRTLVFKKV